MTRDLAADFPTLFLDADDLPAGMTCYGDRRDGVSDPDDPAFARHGGRCIGMTKWEGMRDSQLGLFVDIRWLFADPRSATAYHLSTLTAKSEGKPEDPTATAVGDDCHVYSYPSGQMLGAVQGIFDRALGRDHPMARGIDRAVADMPNDALIYLFTRGPVAVKLFAVLGSSPTARGAGLAAVHETAMRVVGRIDSLLSTNPRKAWWRRFFSA